MSMSMTTNLIGPLWKVGVATVESYCADLVEDVAKEAKMHWLDTLEERWQNPTGAYASNVDIERTSPVNAKVHDHQSLYGPWLEGTGSRNATTSFKGYQSAQDTRDWLNDHVEGWAGQLWLSKYAWFM